MNNRWIIMAYYWTFHVCSLLFVICISLTVVIDADAPAVCKKVSREPVVHEHLEPVSHGRVGRYLKLKCCASHYKSISWMDNGKLVRISSHSHRYDIAESDQVLNILSLQNRERSISCSISWPNGTSTILRTTVKPYECKETEIPTRVEPKDGKHDSVYLGETKTIHCGFRVACDVEGQIDWYKVNGQPGNLSDPIPQCDDNDGMVTENYGGVCTRKSERYLFGGGVRSSLIIKNAQKQHFGRYMCVLKEFKYLNATISLSEKPRRPSSRVSIIESVILVLALFIVSVVVVVSLLYYYWLEVKLYWKDNHSHWVEVEKKDYDAYILYCKREHGGDGSDQTFACNVLTKTLEEKYNYRVFIDDRDLVLGGCIVEDYHENIGRSCCLVMVASNDFFTARDGWCRDMLQRHVQVSNLKVIFVVHREISDDIWDETDALREVFRSTDKVIWPGAITATSQTRCRRSFGRVLKDFKTSENRFWKKLCLHLPPRKQVLKVQKSRTTNSQGIWENRSLNNKSSKDWPTNRSSFTSDHPLLFSSTTTQGSSVSSPGVASHTQPDLKGQSSPALLDVKPLYVKSRPNEKSQPGRLCRQSTLSDEVFL